MSKNRIPSGLLIASLALGAGATLAYAGAGQDAILAQPLCRKFTVGKERAADTRVDDYFGHDGLEMIWLT